MNNAWFFPILSGGMSQDWNDAGIMTFSGSPMSSLAREVTQNSLDARDRTNDRPVHLYFDLIEVLAEEFPDIDGLSKALKGCQKDADEKTGLFLRRALQTISEPKVSFLRMSDKNTEGMKGPANQAGTPFNTFTKVTGRGVKAHATAGGSFGIGKNAPFAASDLRTVFVSTVYENENGQIQELAQGKAILKSHPVNDPTGNLAGANGFFGEATPACGPIRDTGEIPDWLRRRTQFENDEPGTSLFVAGFHSSDSWEKLLLSAVIANYFSAIHDGDLEVSVGGKVVTSDNLREQLENDDLMEAARSEARDAPLRLAGHLYKCLAHPRAEEEEITLDILGSCRIRVLVGENLPSRVGVLRNGMLVTESLKGLQRFPGFSDFAAVVDVLDQDGLEFLRQMENPAHDNFEPDRLHDENEKKRGRKALEELADKTREVLKKHTQTSEGPTSRLDFMAGLFPDLDSGKSTPGTDALEPNLEGGVIIRAKAPPRRRQSTFVKRDPEARDGGSDKGKRRRRPGPRQKGGFGTGEGSGAGQGGTGGRKRPAINLTNIRSLTDNLKERSIWITPTESANADVKVEIAGKDQFSDLEIESVRGFEVIGGMIKNVKLEKDQRVELKVKLKKPFDGAVRVSAIGKEDV
ncbi:MAG: hypothetical protein CME26_16075 [Gemmatimonadetes bacterium]|nr:hypothetical protein [Gemmatimonadota bacterium]|tara:strand:+ start:2842 stop:4746 length:1905 start_codon:yes stop_codon:yes gene_type:complete